MNRFIINKLKLYRWLRGGVWFKHEALSIKDNSLSVIWTRCISNEVIKNAPIIYIEKEVYNENKTHLQEIGKVKEFAT